MNVILAEGLREGLRGRIWLASGLSVLGIFILQSNPGAEAPKRKAAKGSFAA